MGRDPFNYNQTLGISDFLIRAFSAGEGRQDLSEDFGRFPGSWTLPVCDTSTWGYVQLTATSMFRTYDCPVPLPYKVNANRNNPQQSLELGLHR